jgi:hypothetical protein
MSRPLLLLSLLFCFGALQAQKPYFQQEVNYVIDVSLDDKTHIASGNIEITYKNNAPEALTEIRMHLWGNAFKNRNSAFCKQKLADGDGEFYFAKDKDLGFYKNLDFKIDGAACTWKIDPKNPDIARITLPKPLQSGASLRISTPFSLKVPASFSRLGHVGTSYQMTQWYPKPAVYDNRGWHDMPYLDQGEFYSEFGNFDVRITVPANYVVGASGVLQNSEELEFLMRRDAETREQFKAMADKKAKLPKDTFPPSAAETKTLRYIAERVHDFAWFADKRFWVLRDTARLASGKTVDCWAMFTNSNFRQWEKGAFYVRRAVEFYSEHVGDYPWPQATAVHSALSAGGGMEYPMITVIGQTSAGKDLDEVITHEVGHNWFYGILASNERDHPFMDEGLNSYYEQRYMRTYYGSGSISDGLVVPKKLYNPANNGPLLELGHRLLAREDMDTPPDSHSDDFTQTGYGLQVYMKTALVLRWLEQSVGVEKFDQAMKAYYRQWQFKHPYPEDLQAAWKNAGLDAQWFFDAMQTRKKADFAIKKVRKTDDGYAVQVINRGKLDAPVSVSALRDSSVLATEWLSSARNSEVRLKASDATHLVLDQDYISLDVNRKNNLYRTAGFMPGLEPLAFRIMQPVVHNRRTVISALPWFGANYYDRFMAGVLLYNSPVPTRKLQYYLMPGYSTGAKSLVGIGDVRLNMYPGGNFLRRIQVGVSAKSFHFDYNERFDYTSRFYRIAPQVRFELGSGSKTFRHYLNFRTLFIGREAGVIQDGALAGKIWKNNTIHELRYMAKGKSKPNPWQLTVALEQQDYKDAFDRPANYLRGTLEWRQKFFYSEKRKITARAFAGYFLQTSQRNRSVDEFALSLNPQGFNDYRFDQIFLARGSGGGFLSRQVSQTDGGFKGAFGPEFAQNVIGNSNNFVLALNLKADLPQRLPLGIPLRPYFDIGYFDDATALGQGRPLNEQLLWSGGLMLDFFKGGLEIYFPLVNSKAMKDRYCEQGGGTNPNALFCGGNFLRMITWSVRVPFRHPSEALDEAIR